MTTPEKRRSPRKHHDSVMEIFDTSGHFIAGIGRLVDVSTVGACFSSTFAFEEGQLLKVRLRLLKEGVMECPAKIVWIRKKPSMMLYGIAFNPEN